MQSTGLELLSSRPPTAKPKPAAVANIKHDPEDEDEAEQDVKVKYDPDDDDDTNWETILRFASSSITRGLHSIVGNTIPVLEAREIVDPDCRDGKDENEMMREWFGRHDPEDDEVDDGVRWICPGCKGVI